MSDAMIDLAETVDGTTVTNADLILIGTYVLNLACAAKLLRHTSPAGSVDYTDPGSGTAQLVTDFVRWCRLGVDSAEARDRVLGYMERSGWMSQLLIEALPEVGAA